MASVEQIKQEIRQEWYGVDPDHPEPFVAAFTHFVGVLAWRNAQITLPSGVAKLVDLSETRVVFSVGDQLFCAHKDPNWVKNGTEFIADWQADFLYEARPVTRVVVDYEKLQLT